VKLEECEEDTLRLGLCVGDKEALGQDVPDTETLPEVVAQLLMVKPMVVAMGVEE